MEMWGGKCGCVTCKPKGSAVLPATSVNPAKSRKPKGA